jgi:DNA mismatch repair protein MutS2
MPFRQTDKIQKALKQSDDAKAMIQRHGLPEFGSIHNIKSSLKRSNVGASLSPKELLDVGGILRASRKLIKYYENFEETTYAYRAFSNIEKLPVLENKIFESILSLDEISDTASAELHSIRRRINILNSKIRDVLQSIINSAKYQKYLQEPIITVRNQRFVVPVKAEYKNELNGLVHDTSSSGATLFIEPMSVVDINNEIKIFYAKEKDEIERILAELSAAVSIDSIIIEKNYYHIVQLDFIFAKARMALYQDAYMPKLTDKQSVNFIKARHPLIDKKSVVEVNIELGNGFDTLIITGPNTGGKTVALKTLGLLCAMAMAGLLIPCTEGSEVGFFEYIFADIGDEQSIEQSLSTFSSHMSNIVNIIENANSQTMVLFDELGAGTDPVEGAALAISILEYVHGFGAKVAATTHYSELKIYALSTKRVENASCEFDVATLKPTYKLLIGVPGKSNAFAISKRLGLSDYIIENSKKRIGKESLDFEEILSDLEKNRQQIQKERQRANQALLEVEQLKQDIQNLDKKHEEQRNRLLEQARKQAASILEQAKITSEEVIKELED